MKTETYKITEEELKSAFKLTKVLKKNHLMSVVLYVLIALATIMQIVNIIVEPTAIKNYVYIAIILFVVVFSEVTKRMSDKKIFENALKSVSNDTLAEFENDTIHIEIPKKDKKWDIEKENIIKIEENDELLAIILKDNRFVIFPKRVLSDEMIDFVNGLK